MSDHSEMPKEDIGSSKEKSSIDIGSRVVSKVAALLEPAPIPCGPPPHYHTRLLQVYIDLKTRGLLLADLPEWVKESKINLEKADEATAEILDKNPRLQEVLASATAYTPSKWLLEKELVLRDSTRERSAGVLVPPGPEIFSTSDQEQAAETGPARKSWAYGGKEDVYEAAANERLTGVCLSGGGVRSATFCLGVLQTLAKLGKLNRVDYLSTVSGGGYIHEWLASWIHNDERGISGVEEKLVPVPADNSLARTPEQIRWLRRYSSYLTPQRGILSADAWTMIAIWLRNTFLNQIVLFSFLGVCLLLVRAITEPFVIQRNSLNVFSEWRWWIISILIVGSAASSVRLGLALASQTDAPQGKGERIRFALNNPGVVVWAVIPGFVLAVLVALEADQRITLSKRWPFFLLVWIFYLAGIVLATTFGSRVKKTLGELTTDAKLQAFVVRPALTITAILCVIFVSLAALELTDHAGSGCNTLKSATKSTVKFLNQHLSQSPPKLKVHGDIASDGKSVGTLDVVLTDSDQEEKKPFKSHNFYLTFAPVAIFFLQFLAIRLQLGIIGRFCYESRREWLARLGAWSMIVACGWMVLCGIVRLGPNLCDWIFQKSTLRVVWGGIAAIAVHAVTLYSGASSKTDGKPKPDRLLGYSALDLVGMVGAPICILSLLVFAANLIDKVLKSWPESYGMPLLFFGIVFLTFLFFGWRVDVNEFSLHGFYRNRLARCYLGGNNPKRTPDPFTGFDDHEETGTIGIRLSDLLPRKFEAEQNGGRKRCYDGPFPIFCSTLNLTFGEDLATQERKGASFAFTPLYSGYHVGWTSADRKDNPDTAFNGFVPTEIFAYPMGGIPLSYVTAISGAALSPNQGYNSQPALAFLMTLFNVRLNWWIANPRRRKKWPSSQDRPTPIIGFGYLISELFGLANDTSNYVCLCDGGFFENMGLYELVRRRCREIVICDAECDENTVFGGIGNAVAKCRADFGVEISLDLTPLIPDPVSGHASSHSVTGSIVYPAPPGGNGADDKYVGRILYLKTSIVGDETADLLHHKRAFPGFPQDSTADQWFNESQFESYRRLGQLIAEGAL